MKRKACITGVISLCLLLIGLSGCRREAERPAPVRVEKVRICQGGIIPLLPLIAQEKGFFAANGIDAEILVKKDGKLALEGALSGECDFAICGEPPIVASSLSRKDFAVLASIGITGNSAKILARRDMGIGSALDLKGKRIGVRRGTISHFFLDLYLKEKEIAPHEAELVFMEPDRFQEALLKGEIAAFSGSDELVLRVGKQLGERGLVLSDPGLCINSINLVARKEFIRTHRQTVDNLIAALLRSEDELPSLGDGGAEIVQRLKRMSRENAEEVINDQASAVRLPDTLLLTLEDHARWMMEKGFVARGDVPNFLQIIDPLPLRALRPAAVTIGR